MQHASSTSCDDAGGAEGLPLLPFQPVFFGLSQQIRVHGQFRAFETALVEGDIRLDWQSYNARADRIARQLQVLGIARGDRVATVLTNSIWAHELLLGIWRAGAVMVPLSPLLSNENLDGMLVDSGARLLLVSDEYRLRCETLATNVQILDEGGLSAVQAQADETLPPDPVAHDLAVIIYSSGTTGIPKGIAHSHQSRLKFASWFAAEFGFTPHSRALSCVPIHSNGAWLSWAPAKWMGATTIILSHFSAEGYLDLIRRHSPTHGFIAPTMARALLGHPDIGQVGLESFDTLITAGSPMPEADKQAIQRLSNHRLYELWGLTEGAATILNPEDMRTHPNSVGRPMQGCDLRVIDSDGNDVTGVCAGEIVGRSSQMMSGYWNRPDANSEIVWRDQGGTAYLRTGDIGEFDAGGFLTLRGRLKDMIISGGFNVYPVDIEAMLLRHPDIGEACVTGIRHSKWGESPVAFIRLRNPGLDDVPELLAWVNARLSRHQRLAGLYIVREEFPRNSMGKVIKRELLTRYHPEEDAGA